MKYFLILMLPLALTLVSCGGNEAAEAVNEATETVGDVGNDIADGTRDMMNNDAVAGNAGMVSINETVDAVRNAGGDITAIPAGAAVANIDGWIAKLNGIDGTGEVTENLKELKEELTDADGIDGKEVGTLLKALAEDTRELGPDNMALSGLAKALEAGGNKLGGM